MLLWAKVYTSVAQQHGTVASGRGNDRPVLEEKALVDVYSFLVVEAHVVDGC